MSDPLAFQSAKALAARIRRGKLGCQELLDLYLARVEKYNPGINAIIAMDPKAARKRARAADAALTRATCGGRCMGCR
jgi:amidase